MAYDLEHGTGTKYYENGQIFFEGKFSHGGPHGETCVIHHENGSLKYIGAMRSGHYYGFGKGFYEDGSIF